MAYYSRNCGKEFLKGESLSKKYYKGFPKGNTFWLGLLRDKVP